MDVCAGRLAFARGNQLVKVDQSAFGNSNAGGQRYAGTQRNDGRILAPIISHKFDSFMQKTGAQAPVLCFLFSGTALVSPLGTNRARLRLCRAFERFLAAREQARALGYDERFLRLWEFYLAYCEGGFLERSIGVSHLLLARPGARPARGDRWVEAGVG